MKMKYETAFAKLQDIVHRLEDGSLGFDEAIKLYKEGARLAAYCYDYLKNAEQEIITVIPENNADEE